jgi:GTP cyclohydrolase II
MTFSPDHSELVARARADLRMGVPVVLRGPQDIVIAAVETLSPERLSALRNVKAKLVLSITRWRAETLKARAYDGDLARILVPSDADLSWLQSIADPAGDLRHPMKGPLACERDGDARPMRAAIQIAKAARLLPAVVSVAVSDAKDFAKAHDLVCLSLADTEKVLAARNEMEPVIHARLPMAVSEAGRLHVFRPSDGAEEHYAIEIGRPNRSEPVLARLHSACFTGDLLGSLKCDCGPQLRAAMAQMAQEGAGILLYLNQEGRGIGLANKMRAYSLQDQGFDTVEANHRLGFEDDERDFRLGADILTSLGVDQVRLMTNNPRKVDMMNACGVTVTERVPLLVGENPHNRDYLATKRAKSGHLE